MNNGKYGEFGGQYVNEILMPILIELEEAFKKHYPTDEFQE
jgi:tryptophan synthase beta subunit